MVKKKIKSTKKGRKRALKEDVHATTSLPPSVEGQLRCFLRVSISKIVWLCAKPPDTTHVRLRWWGETTEGSIFRPLDVKNSQKTTTRTVARFPIRCGPKQFAAYLSDMGALVVEVLKGPTMQPIGKAQINEIGHLAPQVPINGFFSVFSNKSADKIAELHISLVFEPLPAAYDSSSSIPTTDLSVATAGTGTTAESASIQSQPVRTGPPLPMPRPRRIASSSSEDPFMSPIAKVPPSQSRTDLKQIITPRGVDDDYSFVVGPGKADELSHPDSLEKGLREDQSSDTDPITKGSYDMDLNSGKKKKLASKTPASDSAFVRPSRQLNPTGLPGSDLISSLLDRGTKLRDNMIRSELDRVTSVPRGAAQGVAGVTAGGILLDGISETRQSELGRRRFSGELFREILRTTDDSHKPAFAAPTQETRQSVENDIMDTQTIKLLVGDQISKQELNDLKTLQTDLSPQSSVSSESESLSETEDPLHDQSLLEELFYKRMRSSSDSSLSDLSSSGDNGDGAKETKVPSKRKHRQRRWSYESSLSDPGNQRPPSRKSQQSPKSSAKALPTKDLNIGQNEESGPYVNHHQIEATTNKERLKKSRQLSGSSSQDSNSNSDSEDVEVEKPVNPTEGLSIQRLTLLGRIHIARVMIDSLLLINPGARSGLSQQDRRPSRVEKGKGKPPRPLPKAKTKKQVVLTFLTHSFITRYTSGERADYVFPGSSTFRITYFVEYRFPVATSPHERSLVNTTATEIMRLASKKVDDKGEVTFGHRSVFPIRFDGAAVDNWWKHLLVFKVFSRHAGQKSPTLLGVASLSLRSVLQSPDLALLDVQLDVKDKTQSDFTAVVGEDSSTKNTPKDFIIGTLKVSIELAADGKDFPMALARMKVAEIRGSKIVSLPSNKPHLPIKIPTGSAGSDSKSSSRSLQTECVSTQVVERELVGNEGLPTSSRNETEGGQKHRGNSQGQIQMECTQGEDKVVLEQLNRGKKLNRDVRLQQRDKTTTNVDYESRTLHCLLAISEGRAITVYGVPPPVPGSSMPRPPLQAHPGSGIGISGLGSGRDRMTRNTYLVCRLFWSDDSVRSNVCWGTTDPQYNFIQVSPVLLTSSLLERARNNYMVIEVWDKKTSAQNDQLVGIAKLPLHQFYMSFRDDRIAGTLLKSQYPVAAVDNFINIMDPFTGVQYGQLKVLLALGSAEQISALQQLKFNKEVVDDRPLRPGHYLERGEALDAEHKKHDLSKDEQVEHIFEVVVEGIRGLPQLEDTVWGEADCFIQYHFPTQAQPRRPDSAPAPLTGGPVLMPHQTPTTLCMPDPTFHDVSRHRLQLPSGTPVQRELLTACAGVGGGAGGIPFEVWCRYYYPNVRDQVIAKTCLPLAKLCAMVTMQRRGEPSIQTFSLPLRLHNQDQESLSIEQQAKLQDAGLLDVTVNYRHNVIEGSSSVPKARETSGAHVCLSVGILRACGLKTAAVSLAQSDSSLQYASEVGVNACVVMKLSFLSKQDVRVTQTVARTFAPEFSHHVDFPCPLLMKEEESDHLSLAEALETAEMILEIWHQVPGFKSDHDVNIIALDHDRKRELGLSARRLFAPAGDVLLGTTTVPLHSLLSHKTGLHGWYPISIPNPGWTKQPSVHPLHQPASSLESPRSLSGRGFQRVGGGLELSITFAHQADRNRVIDAGRRVGWSPEQEIEGLDEIWDEEGSHSAEINVHVDSAWFPVHVTLRPGQQALDSTAKAYVRYKLYDKDSVCSKLCYLDVNEENYLAAELGHNHCFQTALTPPLAWYLREERLEIQLWVSYSRELSQTDTGPTRPRQRDKLIGCAYVDMSALCDRRIRQHRVSGLYPVFRPGAADLDGSCLRVHLDLKPVLGETLQQLECTDEAEYPNQDEVRHVPPLQQRFRLPNRQSRDQDQLVDTEVLRRQDEFTRRQEEETEERKRMTEPVLMSVAVERAMHLAMMLPSNSKLEDGKPSSYVTFQPAIGPPVHTSTVPNTDQPVWGFEDEVKISSEVLDRQSFIFKVWHQTSSEPDMNSDRMLGFASVDLAPLLAGFRSLNGWYNISDFAGHCQGQIKISVTPKESVSPLKRSPKAKTTPNTSAVFAQSFPRLPFPTLSCPQPSQPSTSQTARPTSSHYQEHLQNVRKFHEDLHDRLKAQKLDSSNAVQGSRQKEWGSNGADDPRIEDTGGLKSDVSRSFLMQNLRKNLEELDSVYHGLQQKLTSPVRKHESRNSEKPAENLASASMKEVPGNHGDDSRENGQYNTDVLTSPEESHGGLRRTSDDVMLGKIREELRDDDNAEFGDVNDVLGPLRDESSDAEEAASPAFESDWEESVQFHEGQDKEDSDQEEDTILPRPLNDVSSVNFSNAVRPDAVFTGAPQNDHLEREGLHNLSDKENVTGHGIDSSETPVGHRTYLVPGEPEPEPEPDDKFDVADHAKEITSLEHLPNNSREVETIKEHYQESDREMKKTQHKDYLGGMESSSDTLSKNTVSLEGTPERFQNFTDTTSVQFENQEHFEVVSEIEDDEQASHKDHYMALQRELNQGLDRRNKQTGMSQDKKIQMETEFVGDDQNLGSSSDDSVIITIDSGQADKQTDREAKIKQSDTSKCPAATPAHAKLPNFFLPAPDLEASMRALHNVTSVLPQTQPREITNDHDTGRKRTDAAKELTQRLATRHSEAKPHGLRLSSRPTPYKLPTAEEARRIAKIFSSRYSPS